MKLRNALDAISTDGRPTHVYSQPYEMADGTSIITVAKVRAKITPVKANPLEETTEVVAVRAKPVGMFVVRDGEAKWEAAVDSTAVALLGALTGLAAATLATLAMVRRPPWPDLRGTL